MNKEKLEAAFLEMIGTDTEEALKIITGMFVGLLLEYMRRAGHETEGDIMITGGSRIITIHATDYKGRDDERDEGKLDRELEQLRKALGSAKSTLWAISKSFDDHELRIRAQEAYDEIGV